MYNLIEYSDIYSDTSGSLQGFKRDEIVINVDLANVIMLLHLNIKQLLLIILKRWGKKWSKNGGTANILSTFRRSLEISLINFNV